MITPSAYEKLVAKHFHGLGYSTTVTNLSNDYGLDVLAENDLERIAIQVKLYGHTSRQINRQMIMELHGVKDYFDCNRAVLATDGVVRPDAREVADKLNIEVLLLSATDDDRIAPLPSQNSPVVQDSSAPTRTVPISEMNFETVWMEHVVPLTGQVLSGSGDRENTIVSVDWSGIERITSNGRRNRIEIETFRFAINRLLERGSITRDEINQYSVKRVSSGVVLVLSQIPFFRVERSPRVRLVFVKDHVGLQPRAGRQSIEEQKQLWSSR